MESLFTREAPAGDVSARSPRVKARRVGKLSRRRGRAFLRSREVDGYFYKR